MQLARVTGREWRGGFETGLRSGAKRLGHVSGNDISLVEVQSSRKGKVMWYVMTDVSLVAAQGSLKVKVRSGSKHGYRLRGFCSELQFLLFFSVPSFFPVLVLV